MSGDSDLDMAAQPIKNMEVKKESFLEFYIHGELKRVNTVGLKPEMTLNDYIRNNLGLTGTKNMCKEGGCGICIVSVSIENPVTKVREVFAVNSCLVSILSCNGWDITTIEGVGNRKKGYHAIQDRIVKLNGTQCGFCTPGMVMNMYALQQSGKTKMADIENSFGGNTCRCTGYRPILDAFKSLAADSDEALLGILPDIEEIKLCKKDGCEKTCPTPCATTPKTPLYYDLGGSTELQNDRSVSSEQVWFKVSTVAEIFSIINNPNNESRSYRLIAGNTAKGVYKDMNKRDYYIDISGVSELRTHSLSTTRLTIGANCTLAETMDIFLNIADRDEGFKHLTKCADHLDLVANVAVRNIGTLAGNLMIKYAHREFPSDVFLILEIMNAKIVIDNGSAVQSVSPATFLNYNLTKSIIRRIEIPPLDNTFFLETYKIMPRAQNAHGYVNAGFLFRVRNNSVVAASIVYGGINPNFVHATAAEKYIMGKQLFNNQNLSVFFQNLSSDIQPNHFLPDPSPEYRKQLAIALAYKFILSLAPETTLSADVRSGAKKLIRPALSTGVQEYTVNETMLPVGKGVTKLEAVDQASGAAQYTFDLPDAPHQLHAAFVYANFAPGSKLKDIGTSKAMAITGVEAFYKAEDIPGKNTFMAPINPFFYNTDEPLFVATGDTLKFYGQPVGIIVASSRDIAMEASALVEITCDPAQTSPLLTVPAVMAQNATERIHHVNTILPSKIDREAKVKFEGTFNMGCQAHFAMEMQVVQVIPTDDGGLHIQPSTQYIDGVQYAVSDVLKMPANKITITVKRVGGAFGSKLTRSQWTACAAALAAYKLNRPVKMALSMEENMNIIGKRNPAYCTYKVGTDENGIIKYLDQKIYSDVGAYHNCVPVMQTLDALTNTYVSNTFDLEYNFVITDTPASTWARAPGAVEGIAMLENVLEHIAYKTGKDPLDVRMANINPAHTTLLSMINQFIIWSDYRARRKAVDDFNKVNRWRKKGLAVIPISISLQFLVNHYSQISIYHIDGTIAVSHGGVEIGQGINTKVAQVVAYEFGVPIEQIVIRPTDNMISPNNFGTGGALTTESVCMSLKAGCGKLKERIQWAKGIANLPDETPWPLLVKNAWALGVTLTENTMFVQDPNGPNKADYVIYGVCATEVEVDMLTGSHIINRVDLFEDAGDSSNPFVDIGQVEGAFTMGMGYWTIENTVYNHDGRNMTTSTWNYKPPGPKDIPVNFRVKLPSNQPNPSTPYKNKATSEPPTCLGFSVPLAIKDALKSARTQGNPQADGWVPIDGPFTVEQIFMKGMNNFNQYRL